LCLAINLETGNKHFAPALVFIGAKHWKAIKIDPELALAYHNRAIVDAVLDDLKDARELGD
jgi:hypothetical protein